MRRSCGASYAALAVLAACTVTPAPAGPQPQPAQPPIGAPVPAQPVPATGGVVAEPTPPTPPAPSVDDLYPVEAAVADVLSSPLTYIGLVGENAHIECGYRNERVVVIDAYCKGFPKAFGVTVLSPTRGRVKIFAEARAPITKVKKSGYVVFSAESEGPNTVVTPPLSLDMTFDAVVAYNLARARRNLPGCVREFQGAKVREGCSKQLDLGAFIARDGSFVENPPQAWYELVQRIADERTKDHIRVTDATRAAIGQQYAHAHGIAMLRPEKSSIIVDGLAGPITATDDGGLVLVGTKSTAPDGTFVAGASIPVAVRLDAKGKKVWERILKHKRFIDFEAASVVSTRDGFVVYVLSYVDPGKGAVSRLVKLDPQGKPTWEWIGRGDGYVNTVYASTIERTPTGSLRLTGHVQPEKGGKLFQWTGEVDPAGTLVRDEVGSVYDPRVR